MSRRRRRLQGAAARKVPPSTRHDQRSLMIGHARGAAGRILSVVRNAQGGAQFELREAAEQLDMAATDVSFALFYARELAKRRSSAEHHAPKHPPGS